MVQDQQEISAIHRAAISGNDEDLRNIIESEPDLVNSRDAHFGRTPLMYNTDLSCFHFFFI